MGIAANNKTKTIVIASGLTTIGLAGTYCSIQLSRINKQLGTVILNDSLSLLKQQLGEQNRVVNTDNRMYYFLSEVDNFLQVLTKRMECYYNRLMRYNQYESLCQEVITGMINPILKKYQAAQLFKHLQVYDLLREEGNFNNKLSYQLMKLQPQSAKLRQQKKPLLLEISQLQDILLTSNIIDLTEEAKQRIQFLYRYIKSRNETMAMSVAEQINVDAIPIETKQSKDDYLFKLQFL